MVGILHLEQVLVQQEMNEDTWVLQVSDGGFPLGWLRFETIGSMPLQENFVVMHVIRFYIHMTHFIWLTYFRVVISVPIPMQLLTTVNMEIFELKYFKI